MSCTNCPDVPTGKKIIIVYTGGPESAMYAMVRLAIDTGVIHRYLPTVHDDGRIEYNLDPKPLEGYQLEGRVLRPVWPSCIHRHLTARQDDDGQMIVEAFCLNSKGKPLNAKTCATCSNR
jgi:hypothetical protein